MLILLLACTGETFEPPDRVDEDGDGWVVAEDCDDTDAAIHPDAEESCNGLDDNCNEQIDEGVKTTIYQDADGDGYGDLNYAMGGCGDEPGWATNGEDCDDSDLTVHPGADELCNEQDDDCDNEVDEYAVDGMTSYADADGDGYGDPYTSTQDCVIPEGYTGDRQDCDDTDAAIYPGATEVCDDGVRNDCKSDEDQVRELCSLWGEQALGAGDLGAVAAFVGDLDGDGSQDMAQIGASGLELWLDPLGAGTTEVVGGSWSHLAGVGDLDGDGLDDLLASGSGATLLTDSGSWSLSTEELRGDSAGDIDDDGDADLLLADAQAGEIQLWLGPLSGTSTVSWTLSESTAGGAGTSTASTDMNGDGIDDLLVGAPSSDLNGEAAGSVYVLHGPLTASRSLADWDGVLLGESAGNEAGAALAARDGDDDGYGDVLVGAPGYDSDAGVAWISYGPFSGMEGLGGRSTAMQPVESGLRFGQSVALSDLDGDGKVDTSVAGSGTVWMAYAKLEFAVWTTDDSEVFFTAEAGSGLGASMAHGSLDGDASEDLLISGDSESWLVRGAGK